LEHFETFFEMVLRDSHALAYRGFMLEIEKSKTTKFNIWCSFSTRRVIEKMVFYLQGRGGCIPTKILLILKCRNSACFVKLKTRCFEINPERFLI